jgi:hypothetical protein
MALAVSDRLPVLIFEGADAANFVPAANIAAGLDDFLGKAKAYYAKGAGLRVDYRDAAGMAPFSAEYNERVAEAFMTAARATSTRGFQRLSGRAT